ncbi:MAG: radical SAM protein, partial [Pseudomonadota bacterium]
MSLVDRAKWNLFRRSLGLFLKNPNLAPNQARAWYRTRFGMARDRRNRDGWCAPPINISLNLTRRCNLRCLMCEQYRHSDGPPQGLSYYDPQNELPPETWVGLMDQVKPFHPQIYVTGGEPTLYGSVLDVLAAARERGLCLHLQTNGTRLSGLADDLVRLGLEQVTVSLDGPEEVNDRIRGIKGSFERSADGIRALAEARRRLSRPGPLIAVNTVISKASLAGLHQMPAIAASLGADIIQLQHTIFNSFDNLRRHNRILSPEFAAEAGLDLIAPSKPEGECYESEITAGDLPLLRQNIETARREAAGRIQLIFLPNLSGDKLDPYYLDLQHNFEPVCNSLWKSARILPDGVVAPCLHVITGNITEKKFFEIWNGARMRNFRKVVAKR